MPARASSQGIAFSKSISGQGGRPAARGPQPLGDGLLGPVQAGEEDAAPVRNGVGHHRAVLQLQLQRRYDQTGRHLDQRRRELDEFVLGQATVALVHRLGEPVRDARADADHGVLVDADLHRDLVGCPETDAADVAREPVRVLADDLHRIGTVGLEDPHRPGGANPVRVQEQHDLAHHLLFGPAGDDAGRALGADAAHLAQPIGLLLDYVEHLLAEAFGQPLGVDWPDAADHAGAEILLDALQRRGRAGLEEWGPELQPVLAVVGPAADGLHELAGRDQGGMAHHRHEVPLAARLDPQHAETVVGIVERDPLNQAGEVFCAGLMITGGENRHGVNVARAAEGARLPVVRKG